MSEQATQSPSSNEPDDWLGGLFAAIDAADTDRFLRFLTADATFRFGSADALVGHEAIRAGVDGFFATIAASRHALTAVWRGPASLVCEGTVTYTRHDGSQITLPFANVFGLSGERIERYRIYVDIAPLYAS